jgi:hypothetical protein
VIIWRSEEDSHSIQIHVDIDDSSNCLPALHSRVVSNNKDEIRDHNRRKTIDQRHCRMFHSKYTIYLNSVYTQTLNKLTFNALPSISLCGYQHVGCESNARWVSASSTVVTVHEFFREIRLLVHFLPSCTQITRIRNIHSRR